MAGEQNSQHGDAMYDESYCHTPSKRGEPRPGILDRRAHLGWSFNARFSQPNPNFPISTRKYDPKKGGKVCWFVQARIP
jgi:hypothetical protein